MKNDLMPDLDELEAVGLTIDDDIITDTESVDSVIIDNQDNNNMGWILVIGS